MNWKLARHGRGEVGECWLESRSRLCSCTSWRLDGQTGLAADVCMTWRKRIDPGDTGWLVDFLRG